MKGREVDVCTIGLRTGKSQQGQLVVVRSKGGSKGREDNHGVLEAISIRSWYGVRGRSEVGSFVPLEDVF